MSWTTPRTWSVELVTVDEMNAQIRDNMSFLMPQTTGVFATYTPTLTGSTSNPNIGSTGLAQSYYYQIGKMVRYYGSITFGGTGINAGSGNYQISVPVNWAADVGSAAVGTAWIRDNSANNMTFVLARFDNANAGYFVMSYPAVWPTGTETTVTDGTPQAWAASDFIHWDITYQAA